MAVGSSPAVADLVAGSRFERGVPRRPPPGASSAGLPSIGRRGGLVAFVPKSLARYHRPISRGFAARTATLRDDRPMSERRQLLRVVPARRARGLDRVLPPGLPKRTTVRPEDWAREQVTAIGATFADRRRSREAKVERPPGQRPLGSRPGTAAPGLHHQSGRRRDEPAGLAHRSFGAPRRGAAADFLCGSARRCRRAATGGLQRSHYEDVLVVVSTSWRGVVWRPRTEINDFERKLAPTAPRDQGHAAHLLRGAGCGLLNLNEPPALKYNPATWPRAIGSAPTRRVRGCLEHCSPTRAWLSLPPTVSGTGLGRATSFARRSPKWTRYRRGRSIPSGDREVTHMNGRRTPVVGGPRETKFRSLASLD